MSGSNIPSNAARSFTSEASVAVPNVSGIHGLGTTIAMPVPPDPDLSLYATLLVNHGPYAVQVIAAQAADGTVTRLPSGPWIEPHTSKVLPPDIIGTASALTLHAGQAGNCGVEIHRGTVGSLAPRPTFTITG